MPKFLCFLGVATLLAASSCKSRHQSTGSEVKAMPELVEIKKNYPDGSRDVVCQYGDQTKDEHVSADDWKGGNVCLKGPPSSSQARVNVTVLASGVRNGDVFAENLSKFLTKYAASVRCEQDHCGPFSSSSCYEDRYDVSTGLAGTSGKKYGSEYFLYNTANGLASLGDGRGTFYRSIVRTDYDYYPEYYLTRTSHVRFHIGAPAPYRLIHANDVLIVRNNNAGKYVVLGRFAAYSGGSWEAELIADIDSSVLSIKNSDPSCNR